MAQTLVAPVPAPPDAGPSPATVRRTLRAQIADLERALAALPPAAVAAPRPGAAHVLSAGELEAVRDGLAARLDQARDAAVAVGRAQERARVRLERMLLDPGAHRFARVALSELGESGCGAYAVRPRLGLIGMLMGWWHVKLSSGCPLAT